MRMLMKFVFILLFGWTVARQNHRILSSFHRAEVESIPYSAAPFFENYGFDRENGKTSQSSSDSFSLPSRYAVEHVPSIEERAEEHFPIRDAVEKIPHISEYLENFKSHTLQKQTPPEENSYRVVCYLPNWSYHRGGTTKFTPDYVDPNLCTHIVYAHAALSPENYTIILSDQVVDVDNGFYKKITSKEVTSVAKVLISIGGWTDSTGDKYSKLVSSGGNRRRFVSSVIAFLRRHNFQGLHFDWNYPVCWQSRCSEDHASDRENFVKLIQELRQEFVKHNPRYELAIAVSGYKEIINAAYDILNLGENVDFFSVMTYDYHGAWENRTGHLSPLYSEPNDRYPDYSTHTAMTTLVMQGADPKKLVMGIPLYGQSFTLADSNRHGFGDESVEPGEPGEITQQPGILSYTEICLRTTKLDWQSGRNVETGTDSYAYKGNQWVGYDDKHSIRRKVNYLMKSGYGGIMAWTLDMDDFNNECCTGVYPLLQEVNVALGRLPPYPGVLDCTKPVIIPLANSTTSEATTDIDEVATSASTLRPAGSWVTNPIYTRPTTQQWTTGSQWWPAEMTSRQTVGQRPKPTAPTMVTASTNFNYSTRPSKNPWTTTLRTTTRFTTHFENPEENEAEETTPASEQKCVDGNYYQDPTSCGSYFICVFGQKRRNYCPSGLHWNHNTHNCDWPSKASCRELLIQSTTAASTGSTWPWASTHPTDQVSQWWPPLLSSRPSKPASPSTTQSTKSTYYSIATTITTPTPPVSTAESQNSNKPEGNDHESGNHKETECESGRYYKDDNNCAVYYQCVYGRKKKHTCPNGLHWNRNNQNCDWPSASNCQDLGFGPSTKPTKANSSEWPLTQESSSTTPSTAGWWTSSSNVWWTTPTTPSTNAWWTRPTTPSTADWWTSSSTSSFSTWWTQPSSQSTNQEWSPSTAPTTSTWWTWTESPPSTRGTLPTTKPPRPIANRYKVVCYFTNWAWYRPGVGKFYPEDTDTNLCTHIVYGFIVLDYEGKSIRIHDSWADVDNRFFERVAALKKRGVKVSVAIGGWNDSAGDKYSRLVNDPSARANFISSVLRFINKYGFEGLDLDWEYPKCWQTNCNKGPDSDKEAFSALVSELRDVFNQHGYLLSAAVSPSKQIIDKGYDVPLLSEKLDWIAVMTYDFHGQWDKKTGHVAPIYYIPGDEIEYFNAYSAITYWIEKGAKCEKIVMGMPMYGQGFTLSNIAENGLNAPASGPSQAGQYTRSAGFLAYYEICQKIKNEQWTVVQDAHGRRGPYAYKGDQWVGFDDVNTIQQKVNLIKKLGLGGGMIWALDLDDFQNVCGDGHYPLLTTIAEGLSNFYTDYEIQTSPSPETELEFSVGPSRPSYSPSSTNSESSTSYSSSSSSNSWTSQSTRKRKPTRYPKPTTPSTPASSSEFNEFTEDNNVSGWSSSTSSVTSSTTDQPPAVEDRFKVVCYYTNWAWYRQGKGRFMVQDINYNLCTHVIYAFAVLDSSKLVIKPHDSWADIDNKFYEKFVALKQRGLKVILAIGGWNDSAGNKYSRMVNSKSARSNFITHVVKFLKKYNFDGLDVDWEYPKCWQVNCKLGPASDKKAFSDFITELREVFDEHNLLLSAAVSPNKKVIDEGYDVPLLSEKLDWISVMCYDYHGQWDEVTGHVAPMYEHPDDVDKTFNANYSIHYWVRKGASPHKIIMGMPMYGQSFTLANAKNSTLNSRAYGGGEAGEITRARGFLSYYEICDRVLRRGWDVEYDVKGRMGPYAKRGSQWVSFDDQAMIRHKAQYVLYNNLGGAMIWALDLDDFRGLCGCGSYPLLKTINKVLRNSKEDVPECNLESNSRTDMKLFYQNEGAELFSDLWKFETCQHGEVKKHPTDCTKYLTCPFGVYLQEQACANGLHFNEIRGTCDWPENSNCKPTIMEYAEAYFLNNLQKQNLVKVNKTEIENKYKVVCYLTNWSAYRYNNLLFPIQALDNRLCTNIVYGFVMLDQHTLTIRSNDTFTKIDNEFFKRVRVLKETGVKISLGLGGWYDSQENKYSRLVSSRAARTQFIKHAVKFLKEHDFDGLEIDWEYPKCWQVDCSKGPISDKSGFANLLKELKEAFWKNNLLLSAAVSPSKEIIDQAYEVPSIFSSVDWLSLMTYDYHGYWEGKADHIAPLYPPSNDNIDNLSVDSSVSYWIEKGAPPEKLILGLPLYGQSFTLKNATSNKIGSKVIGPGHAGRHTRVPGFLAYYEICEMAKQVNWKTIQDKNGHYTFLNDQWISFNDISDIKAKGRYVKENNLGGAVIWSLDLDDFVNVCGCGPSPLLFAINEELTNISHRKNSVANCT